MNANADIEVNDVKNVELPLIYQGVKPKEIRERAIKSLDSLGLKSKMKLKKSFGSLILFCIFL
jgi:ABC-type ATPase involved in cell division